MKNIKNGFTLIELLVVISIIGILAALLMSNFAAIRERARDTQRKSDLKQIQKAFELYKDAQAALQYPQSDDRSDANNGDWNNLTNDLTTNSYMKKVPVDPLNKDTYVYTYTHNASDTLDYSLKACLENKSDKDGVADASCTGSGISYTVSPP